MAYKPKRIEMLIRKNISEILSFELNDPNIGFVTVTDLNMSQDYQYARIFVTFLAAKNPSKNLEALKKAKGCIRSSLAKKMSMYKIPQLEFILDDSYDKASRLDEILAKEEKKLEELNENKGE